MPITSALPRVAVASDFLENGAGTSQYRYPLAINFRNCSLQTRMWPVGYSYIYPFTTTVSKTNFLTVNTTSVKTPGWHAKKSVRIRFVPKKHSLKPPVQPVLRLPPTLQLRLRKFSPKTKKLALGTRKFRNERQADRFYAAYLIKARKTYDAYELRTRIRFEYRRSLRYFVRQIILAKHAKKIATYELKLAKYKLRLKAAREGFVVMRRVASGRTSLQNNPFSRTITWDGGASGVVYKKTLCHNYEGASNWDEIGGRYVSSRYACSFRDIPYVNAFYNSPSVPSSAEKSANSRCLLKLKRKVDDQEVHIGNLIAERAQTFKLLRNTIGLILEIKTSPRRWIQKELKKSNTLHTKDLSDNFLALQFGVRPLLQDVYNSFKFITEKSATFPDTVVVRAVSDAFDTAYEEKVPYFTYAGNLPLDVSGPFSKAQFSSTTSVKVSYVLEYKVVNGALSALQKFGLVNPAEIAWEVMPWSFVIDWFLPIGDYIRSLSAPSALQFVTGTKTVRKEVTTEAKVIHDASAQAKLTPYIYEGGYTGSRKTMTKVRTVLSAPPFSIVDFSFKNPISAYHIAEAIALLAQRIR